MSNVLMLHETNEPAFFELAEFFRRLESQQLIHFRERINYKVTLADLNWSEVIIFIRSTSDIDWRLAKYSRECGKYCVLFLDDDFLLLDEDYGADGLGYWRGRQAALITMARNVDCILGVNDSLIEKYQTLGGITDAVRIDTPIDKGELYSPDRTSGSNRVKIVAYSNDGTSQQFEKIVMPALSLLSNEVLGRISLHFLSMHPDTTSVENSFEAIFVPHMSFEAFKRYLGEQEFDLGLAPLDDLGFSRFKYFNKYIEYSRAGIPGIYSNCSLYRQVVQNGVNGFLCDNTPSEWCRLLELLVKNAEDRCQVAQNAQDDLLKRFSRDSIEESVLSQMPALVQPPQGVRQSVKPAQLCYAKSCYWLFRLRGWIHTFYAAASKGGIAFVVKMVKERAK